MADEELEEFKYVTDSEGGSGGGSGESSELVEESEARESLNDVCASVEAMEQKFRTGAVLGGELVAFLVNLHRDLRDLSEDYWVPKLAIGAITKTVENLSKLRKTVPLYRLPGVEFCGWPQYSYGSWTGPDIKDFFSYEGHWAAAATEQVVNRRLKQEKDKIDLELMPMSTNTVAVQDCKLLYVLSKDLRHYLATVPANRLDKCSKILETIKDVTERLYDIAEMLARLRQTTMIRFYRMRKQNSLTEDESKLVALMNHVTSCLGKVVMLQVYHQLGGGKLCGINTALFLRSMVASMHAKSFIVPDLKQPQDPATAAAWAYIESGGDPFEATGPRTRKRTRPATLIAQASQDPHDSGTHQSLNRHRVFAFKIGSTLLEQRDTIVQEQRLVIPENQIFLLPKRGGKSESNLRDTAVFQVIKDPHKVAVVFNRGHYDCIWGNQSILALDLRYQLEMLALVKGVETLSRTLEPRDTWSSSSSDYETVADMQPIESIAKRRRISHLSRSRQG